APAIPAYSQPLSKRPNMCRDSRSTPARSPAKHDTLARLRGGQKNTGLHLCAAANSRPVAGSASFLKMHLHDVAKTSAITAEPQRH
ncbi:MAG: hypothetical protein V3V75_04865, partial [Thermoguttaceae bacterium]